MKCCWQPLALPTHSLTESPRHAHGTWAWVDIGQRCVWLEKTDNLPGGPGLRCLPAPDEMACILPTRSPLSWVLLGRQGLWAMRFENDVAQAEFALVRPAPYDTTQQRFNDGGTAPDGHVWVSGLMDARQPADAALYRLGQQGFAVQADGLIVGNGFAFDAKHHWVYFCDTRQRTIWRAQWDAARQKLQQKQVLYTYTQGTERPDGATLMNDGSYLVAVYEGYRLDEFGPDGTLKAQWALPVARPTMPCFGGARNAQGGQGLIVTCARADEKFPNHPGFEDAALVMCHSPRQGQGETFCNALELQV